MTKPPSPFSRATARQAIRTSLEGRHILVLDPTQTIPQVLQGVGGVSISVRRFTELNVDTLNDEDPDVILAPLVSAHYDILDLIRHLHDLGYEGAVRAYCHPLPDLKLVHAEVAQIWPSCDFDLFVVPAAPPVRH